MPQPSLAELLQMSLSLEANDRADRQMQMAQLQQQQSAMQSYITNLGQVQDPNQLEAMKGYYSDSYGIPRGVLDEMAGQYAPTLDGLQRNLALGALKKMQGMPSGFVDDTPQMDELMNQAAARAATGMDQGSIAQSSGLAGAFRDPSMYTRNAQRGHLFSATGFDPGRLAVSEATASLGQDELQRGARIGMDLELGERSLQQAEQFSEQLGEQARQFNTSFGRGMFESDRGYGLNLLQLQAQQAAAQDKTAKAMQEAAGMDPAEALELYRKSIQELESTKGEANRQAMSRIAGIYMQRAIQDPEIAKMLQGTGAAPSTAWERMTR